MTVFIIFRFQSPSVDFSPKYWFLVYKALEDLVNMIVSQLVHLQNRINFLYKNGVRIYFDVKIQKFSVLGK